MKTCTLEGCNTKYYAKGYCFFHYYRKKLSPHISLEKEKYPSNHTNEICNVVNCGNNVKVITAGLCKNHYQNLQFRKRRGKEHIPLTETIRTNEGKSEYPDHYLMKKSRLEMFKRYPLCQVCSTNKSKEIHHIDKSKDNHSIDNLLAVCTKCHGGLHKGRKNISYKKIYGITLREIAFNWKCSTTQVRKILQVRADNGDNIWIV